MKISGMPNVAAQAADQIPVVRGGDNVRVDASTVGALGAGPPPTQLVNGSWTFSVGPTGAVTSTLTSFLVGTSGGTQVAVEGPAGSGGAALLSSSGANVLVNGVGNAQLLGAPGNSVLALGNGSCTMTALGFGQSALLRFFPGGGQVQATAAGVTITCGANTFQFTLAGELRINGNPGTAGQRITSGGVGAPISWAA